MSAMSTLSTLSTVRTMSTMSTLRAFALIRRRRCNLCVLRHSAHSAPHYILRSGVPQWTHSVVCQRSTPPPRQPVWGGGLSSLSSARHCSGRRTRFDSLYTHCCEPTHRCSERNERLAEKLRCCCAFLSAAQRRVQVCARPLARQSREQCRAAE